MKREYRDHQGREWFALHVRTGEERDVALAVYGLGDADSLLPVEYYTTRGQERERILMPGYVFVGCVMNADMWQRLRHLRGVLRILGEPYEAIPEEQMTAVMALYWHGVQGTKVIRQNGVTEVIGGPLLEVTHTITCADAGGGSRIPHAGKPEQTGRTVLRQCQPALHQGAGGRSYARNSIGLHPPKRGMTRAAVWETSFLIHGSAQDAAHCLLLYFYAKILLDARVPCHERR